MAEARGTLEVLLTELTRLVGPLVTLTPKTAPGFIAELGLPMTEAQAQQIAPALAECSSNAGAVAQLMAECEQAIEAGDTARVIEKGAAVMDRIAKTIASLDELKTAVQGLNLPGGNAVMPELPERIFSNLLATYFDASMGAAEALELTGILRRTDHNVGSVDPQKPFHTVSRFEFDRVGGWLDDPKAQLQQLYDWGSGGFDGKKLFAVLYRVLAGLGMPADYDPGAVPPVIEAPFGSFKARTDVSPRGVELAVPDGWSKGASQRGRGGWTLTFNRTAAVAPGTRLLLQPGKASVAAQQTGEVSADYEWAGPTPLRLLSIDGIGRIEVGGVEASAGVEATPSGKVHPTMHAALRRGKLLITTEGADGFIARILGGLELESSFDLGVGFTVDEGVHFDGSSSLEIQLASHVELGPVEVTAVSFEIGVDGKKFPLALTADMKAELGPLVASVEGVGVQVTLELTPDNDGSLGPLDLGFGFHPPKGAGLSLDAGAVVGGGYLYFDPDKQEYAGALELEILGMFSANAIGLITTRMPDGSEGFSLLIIISVEFTPGFQLGWGFTLNAVGGLVGLNRTMALDRLREGVRTNSIASIMFPKDIIENAPRIISDLREIFPPEEGKFLIGPMAKLGWGTPSLITLSLGVIIEIPGNIAIVGILRIALPTEDVALINLQVNFVGTLDFDKKMLTFDASLYESRILWITLEGDMAVRLKWGDNPSFLLSVGGFHPQFEPPPLDLPSPMKRISCSILDTSWGRIRIMNYQAVTSNTVQFGARAELYFGFSEFNVDGHLGFDALFQFNPFRFIIEMSAGLTLHVFGADVLSIRLRFSLEGPTPWRAKGRGSVTILFWDIDVDFDETWGDRKDTTLPSVPVLPRIVEDLSKPSHWKALPPSSSTGLWVALRPIEAAEDALVLHPAGSLTVTEKVVPLAFKFDKVGSEEPADINEARIASATSGSVPLALTPVKDKFAPAQYTKMSGADAVSSSSFQPFECGMTVSAAGTVVKTGTAVRREVRYEITIIDKEPGISFLMLAIELLGTSLFTHFLGGSAVARSTLSMLNRKLRDPFEEKISVIDEPFAVVFAKDNSPLGAAATFAGDAMAKNHLAAAVAADPSLAGQLQVVPVFEAAVA